MRFAPKKPDVLEFNQLKTFLTTVKIVLLEISGYFLPLCEKTITFWVLMAAAAVGLR